MLNEVENKITEEKKRCERQGFTTSTDDLNSMRESLLEQAKKEKEKEEERASPFTSKEKLRGMLPHQLVDKIVGLEAEAHAAKLDTKRYKHGQKAQIQRVQELERRNKELEGVIYGFQQETDELQKLADRLTDSHS